jgi:hypothetical protein
MIVVRHNRHFAVAVALTATRLNGLAISSVWRTMTKVPLGGA